MDRELARVANVRILTHYTLGIAVFYLENPEIERPDDLSVFDTSADRARRSASDNGELDELLVAIDTVLAHDEAWLLGNVNDDLSGLIGVEPWQEDATLRAALRRYRERIWPDDPPAHVADELVKEPLQQWRARRQSTPRG